ncbi:hypothetical protein NDA01_03345 [Trichocoleus desertorum AS-A10]|uniref:ABC-three component system protein n=1 Tax=Trichocoleus desertorum TaxID=1481672 RepID=UPI003296CA8C
MANQFSANAPALGYLYQIRYSLLVLLQKIRYEPEIEISIEQLDDVAFEKEGEPIELFQLKHHINTRASLSNASSDLWKTIRVWSEYLVKNPGSFNDLLLILITTSNAPNSSIADKLRRNDKREETQALEDLIDVATDSSSESNAPCYRAFLSLSDEQKQLLISKIYIVDASPNIQDVERKILREISVASRFPEALKTRLEGWWFKRAVDHLADTNRNTIKGFELQSKIYDLQDEFRPENLPNDFPEIVEMNEEELNEDERLFVEQLRLILIGQTRLRIAIGDYYRAFHQRSKWLNEGLLFPGELEKYESYLVGEWRRQFEIMREDMGESSLTQERMAELGKALFRWAETSSFTPIRPNFLDSFLSRGSYHMLANKFQIGWHPEFTERLGHLIEQAANQVV